MMDYPCGKFGDSSFSRFGSIARTNRHTGAQTPMNSLLPRLSSIILRTPTQLMGNHLYV